MTAGRSNSDIKSVDWNTPLKYKEAIHNFFDNDIDLDPCSNQWSIMETKIKWIPPHDDGLKNIWNYKTIYVNPPYGRNKEKKTSIKDWLSKCSEANEDYSAEVLALIPVSPNTLHWKKFIWPKAMSICFLYDTRLKFLENGIKGGNGAPMACAIIYWGKYYDKFLDVFKEFGAVVKL